MLQKALAKLYKDSEHTELDDDTQKEFRYWVACQYKLLATNYNIKLVDGEPYKSFEDMKTRFHESGKLMISTLHNDSPILLSWSNFAFRAIHDYTHIKYNHDFSFVGECRTFREQVKDMKRSSSIIRHSIFEKILFSEIVLQAAYYLEYGEFPQQKVVIV